MSKKLYEVETIVNGCIVCLLIFKTRTSAQQYINNKLKKCEKENYYIRFSHYTNWGKFKTPYHEMTLDSFTAEDKRNIMCVRLRN
jgi:hypothetical protein